MQSNKYKNNHLILFIIFCLFIFSLFVVYSGSGQYIAGAPFHFVIRQVIWYILGIAIMFVIARFDYELLEKWAFPLYLIGVFLLLLVHFFGVEKHGSQRWLNIGILEIQPSEFMKIFLIIYLAFIIRKVGKSSLSFKSSIPLVAKITFYSFIPFFLIFSQPDLGTSLVIVGITISLIFVSSISSKMIFLLFSSVTTVLGLLVYLFHFQHELFTQILKPHQLTRIYGWLDPGQYASNYGYQLQQAMTGIGSGQLTGKGFNEGVQVQSGKIPEAHTDFIFAVIGEEFGFLGACLLLILYFLLIYCIIQIALHTSNLFGIYICVGAVGLFSLQIFQNIGMTIGLMPITGIALPFISYGGSALLTNFVVIGLVFSVQNHTKHSMFSDNEVI